MSGVRAVSRCVARWLLAAMLAAASCLWLAPSARAGTLQRFSLGENIRDVMVTGPDGNLWVSSDKRSAIGRVTPQGQ